MNGQEKQYGRIVSTCVAALIAILTVATTLAVATALASTAPASSEPGSAQSPIDLRSSEITFRATTSRRSGSHTRARRT